MVQANGQSTLTEKWTQPPSASYAASWLASAAAEAANQKLAYVNEAEASPTDESVGSHPKNRNAYVEASVSRLWCSGSPCIMRRNRLSGGSPYIYV